MLRHWCYVLILFLATASLACGGTVAPAPAATPTTADHELGAAGSSDSAETIARVQVEPTTTPAPTTTPLPSPTSTVQPPSPTTAPPSPTASASPTPAAALRQLTTGGCCTQPFWSPDSRQLRFIDSPPGRALGIWGVDVTRASAEPAFVTDEIGFYTNDMVFRIEPGDEVTTIERLADGERWTVPAGGRFVSISPDLTRIAWTRSNRDVPWERRSSEVWVADLDGANARSIDTFSRSSVVGWLTDDVLLLEGRESRDADEDFLYTFSLASDPPAGVTELIRVEDIRGAQIAPGGAWVAFYTIFSDTPDENGLWVVRTDGSEQRRLDTELFGAYQWRPNEQNDAPRLLIIPYRPEAEFHTVWELDVASATVTPLTDPAETPIKIANGDWTVSPDGRHIAYVDSRDDNIWMLTLQ